MVLSDSNSTDHSVSSMATAQPALQVIDSSLLLNKTGRVWIQHRGQLYELRETRLGKLILTK
jgi:hemin uptake protein HemP